MSREIPLVVNELLRYRIASQKATRSFEELKHNRDLCPRVRNQLELLLQSYQKYDAVTYDVQGIHDRGTDVMLKYWPEGHGDEAPWRAIAFQVKSYDDLKKKDYLKDLRSQCYQAKDEFGEKLEQYVILLCTSIAKHQDKVREVAKAFSTDDKVLVVFPEYAVNFLRLRETHVRLVVDSYEREADLVLDRAKQELGSPIEPTRVATLLRVVYHGIFESGTLSWRELDGDPFLQEVYAVVPDDYDYSWHDNDDDSIPVLDPPEERRWTRSDSERLRHDIDSLIGDVLTIDSSEELLTIDRSAARALQALLLDFEVRYNVRGAPLLEHVFGLLGVMQIFGLEFTDALWDSDLVPPA